MKINPKIKHCELYDFSFYYFIGLKFEDFASYAAENFGILYDGPAQGLVEFLAEDKAIVIYTETIDKGLLVHESVHAANVLFKEIGHALDLDNDEPQAYLVEWIFNNAR